MGRHRLGIGRALEGRLRRMNRRTRHTPRRGHHEPRAPSPPTEGQPLQRRDHARPHAPHRQRPSRIPLIGGQLIGIALVHLGVHRFRRFGAAAVRSARHHA